MKHGPPPESIRAALMRILPTVQKPARYVGIERNLVRKGWSDVPLRVALLFPDAYEIGMSHQGTRILYHLINRRPDTLAERSFAPMPDMAEALRDAAVPLYSLESYHAVRDFDVVGISLQSELNYVNVPYVLDLAGIARRAADRHGDEAVVIGGGPCTANPEPVADFFDAFLIGDAEAGLDRLLDVIRDARAAGVARADLLHRLAEAPGVYVPQLYDWRRPGEGDPGGWTRQDEEAPLPVPRVWAEALDPDDQPSTPIVPFAEVVQDRLGMEIMRGCTQGCRFCQAGIWYRPVREHDPQVVLERIRRQVEETGFEEVGLLSLSTADYSQVEPLVERLAAELAPTRVSVSLPSLRADAFSVGLVKAASKVRRGGFTFAPETGSDRLRRVINKTFTNADMLAAAEAAFAGGWDLIKVYAMIGLPTETDEDLEDLAALAEELVRVGRRERGHRAQVKVSVGCFVPKAWTAFQWEPFVPVAEQQRRIEFLRQRFRRIRGARLTWSDPEDAALEALLARGDRSLSATIERAHDLGAVFDGWSDHRDAAAWRQAILDTDVDEQRELGPRSVQDALPWDVIAAGVRKDFLRAERRRSRSEHTTRDCKWGRCSHCGIPGEGEDTRLAPPTLPLAAPGSGNGDQAACAASDRPRSGPVVSAAKKAPAAQQPSYRRYRLRFSKLGDARFLSHRQVMDAMERALRAAGAPVRYTEGYNPHIRLSMGPPLPVGHEGAAEPFDVDCTAPLRAQQVEAVNRLLPEGIQVVDATLLLPGAPSLGKLLVGGRYAIGPRRDRPWPRQDELETVLPEELRRGVLRWLLRADGGVEVDLDHRGDAGPVVTVKKLLAGLGVPDGEVLLTRVTRVGLILRPGNRRPGQSPPAGPSEHPVHHTPEERR